MTKKIIYVLILVILGIGSMDAQNWLTDISQAKELAKEKNQSIILVFQGSDWCAPCMKLEREVWSTEEFKGYASENYVLLKADFPKKRKNLLDVVQQKKNNELAETYNTDGYFPLVVVLDHTGKVLGKTGYEKLPAIQFIDKLNSFK